MSELLLEDMPVSVEPALKYEYRQEDHQNAMGINLRHDIDRLTEVAEVARELAKEHTRNKQHWRIRNLNE